MTLVTIQPKLQVADIKFQDTTVKSDMVFERPLAQGTGQPSALTELLAWARTILLLYMAAEGLVPDVAEDPASHRDADRTGPGAASSPNLGASAGEFSEPKPNQSAVGHNPTASPL